ncbi:uncharacterized protein ACOB8E_004574 isoform 2-T3 [Sarcophilus harrisii]
MDGLAPCAAAVRASGAEPSPTSCPRCLQKRVCISGARHPAGAGPAPSLTLPQEEEAFTEERSGGGQGRRCPPKGALARDRLSATPAPPCGSEAAQPGLEPEPRAAGQRGTP